jgi:hypothetical protein
MMVASSAGADILLTQQGMLRSSAGTGVDGPYSMIFTVYNSSSSLVALWSESHPAVEVSGGVFRVVLGAEEALPLSVFTENTEIWMGVAVSGEAELTRVQLTSVAMTAMAQYATTAASLSGPISSLECSGCIDTADLADGAVSADKIAPGAVQAYHVNFVYAGSDVPGGAAAKALDVECEGCVELSALAFEPATMADVDALGPSLDSLGCEVGESPQLAQGGWGCAKVNLQGLSDAKANGYELIDGLGYVWDGLERPAVQFEAARAKCLELGARLPTVAELYRNRNNASGAIGQAYQGNYLWSGIERSKTTSMIVRWSNGSTTYSTKTSNRNYRCVWPDHLSSSFDGDHCMGGCFTTADGHYNLDKADRPAMPLMAAIRECAAVNARVPDLWEMESAIRSGLTNGTGYGVWTGDQYKGNNNGPPFIGVTWKGTNVAWFPPQKMGGSNSYNGYWADNATPRTRCIGIADRSQLTGPKNGEFSNSAEMTAADEEDRAKVQYFTGIDVCRTTGGHLLDNIEGLGLILAGLPNGSEAGIWTAEHYDLPMLRLYWKDINQHFWPSNLLVGSGTGFGSSWYNQTQKFRCIYYATTEWTEPVNDCKGGCDVSTNQGSTMAIDNNDRTPSTYFDSVDHCRALGARLPSARDMEEMIRAGAPNGVGSSLWTSSSYVSGTDVPKIMVRWVGTSPNWFPVNDFTTGVIGYSSSLPGVPSPYRCVWTNEVH